MFLTLRIDERTKQILKKISKSENRSMSKQSLLYIEQGLAKWEKLQEKKKN